MFGMDYRELNDFHWFYFNKKGMSYSKNYNQMFKSKLCAEKMQKFIRWRDKEREREI